MGGIRNSQYCARCRNHGFAFVLKGHKKSCAYKLCACEKCLATKDRQSYIAKEIAMHRYEIKNNNEEFSLNNPLKLNLVRRKTYDSAATSRNQLKNCSKTQNEVRRNQQCSRCRNHGHSILLRGHKNLCPFSDCACSKCEITMRRREIMAKQIKDYRNFKLSEPVNLPLLTEMPINDDMEATETHPFVAYEPMENRDEFYMLQSLFEKYTNRGSEEKIQLIYAFAHLSRWSWGIVEESLEKGAMYAKKFAVQHSLIAYQNNPHLASMSITTPNVVKAKQMEGNF